MTARRGDKGEQIVGLLGEAEVLNAQGQSIVQLGRVLDITENTYNR
jgi:hypothetical protein